MIGPGVQLVFVLGGEVEVVVGKLASLVVHRCLVSELELGGRQDDLVSDVLSADGVDDFIVDDLDGPVGGDVAVEVRRVCDVLGADFEGDAKGIEFGVGLCGNSLLVLDGGISVSVDGGVDAE